MPGMVVSRTDGCGDGSFDGVREIGVVFLVWLVRIAPFVGGGAEVSDCSSSESVD